jgi:putative ABC transport system permease protein
VSPLLLRSGIRYLLRHPWQAVLSVVGVALGVAVVVGVDLARESARRSFLLSTEAVTGRATHQVVGGPAGLPDSTQRRLRIGLGVRAAAPVVEGWARLSSAGRSLRVLGVDPFAEAPFRPYVAGATRDLNVGELLTRPGAALLAAATAAELNVAEGDSIAVRVNGVDAHVHVAGLLEPEDELSRRAIADLLVMDIAAAQELLGRVGTLDRIDLRLDGDVVAERARIAAALPAGVRILDTGARTESTASLTRAFEVNLMALGLVALVFGMFLIYNAITFSVVQRRELIGLLRAQGVTRREVFALVLGEAALVGLVATAIGLALGTLLGNGLVRLVTRTINDLYFTVTVTDVTAGPELWVKGLVLGVGATLLAALPPAREATTTSPRGAMQRSVIEGGARSRVRPAAFAGVLLFVAGAALLAVSGRDLMASFAALFLMIGAGALLAPAGTVALMRVVAPAGGAVFGALGRLAVRGVGAALSRTGPAVAALAVAIAVGIAMGLLIGSFRNTVTIWLEGALVADVYVSPPASTSERIEAELAPATIATVRATSGVAGVSTYRNALLPLEDGDLRIVAVDLYPSHREAFRLLQGESDAAWRDFERGAVLISEPLSYRRRLDAGDSLRVPTDRGEHAFPIAGVFRDYATEHGVAFVDRATYDRFFDDPGIGSLAVFAERGVNVDTLVTRLRALNGSHSDVLFRSNRGLRESSLEVFDRTFAITVVLRALALIVAFVGVLGALMALQLERGREFGVLRAMGVTPRQLLGLVTAQTGLMGLAAGIIAIPLGLVLAWTMIHVVNRRSFGWTIGMQLDPSIIAQSVALAVLAALLAGAVPALRMARSEVSRAVREE